MEDMDMCLGFKKCLLAPHPENFGILLDTLRFLQNAHLYN